MAARTDPPSRRAVLLGLGATALVGACASRGNENAGGSSSSVGALRDRILVPRFSPSAYAGAGVENRLVFSLVKPNGDTVTDGPRDLAFTFTSDGKTIGNPIPTAMHDDGVPVPYYPVRFTPPTPGTYFASVRVDGKDVEPQAFTVSAADQLAYPAIGSQLPVADTPTVVDARGVDPICTLSPGPCPLHDRNLRDALATGAPTALLVSTPKYCQIGVCGPVLDLVLEQVPAHPSTSFIHAEVYKTPGANPANPSAGGLAPVVEALGMDWEPSLFVVDAQGKVVDRLDNVFDRVEIDAALARLGS